MLLGKSSGRRSRPAGIQRLEPGKGKDASRPRIGVFDAKRFRVSGGFRQLPEMGQKQGAEIIEVGDRAQVRSDGPRFGVLQGLSEIGKNSGYGVPVESAAESNENPPGGIRLRNSVLAWEVRLSSFHRRLGPPGYRVIRLRLDPSRFANRNGSRTGWFVSGPGVRNRRRIAADRESGRTPGMGS